jgi:hypothetical protein
MTEQEQAAMNAGKTQKSTKKTSAKPNDKPPETNRVDFSADADYRAGQALADRKLQAFNMGYRDRMGQIQDFLHTEYLTNTGTFQIETTHVRSLPSSESRSHANNSLMSLLYGDCEVTQDEG